MAVGGVACTGTISQPSEQEAAPPGSEGSTLGGAPGGKTSPGAPARACVHDVPLRRLSKTQYANVIKETFAGHVIASPRFPQGEMGASRTGFSTEQAVNEITTLGAEEVLLAAEDVALSVSQQLPALLPCAATEPTAACAATFLATYGPRLFRRPLRAEESQALLALSAEGEGPTAFADGIAFMTAALLQAPDFQYVIEKGVPLPSDPTLAALTPMELAHRMSLLYWDGLPDKALLDAAAAGALATPEGLRVQALRMLADPRARPTLSRFAREWLQLPTLKAGDRKGLTDQLAAAQLQELELFVQDAFMGEGTLAQLLAGRETFVDAVAAQSYGVAAAGLGGAEFKKVPVPEVERAGVVTMPAVMTAKAHTDEPSYVTRGLFVLQKLLCTDLASPPANATQMLPAFPADATQRQKSALIRKQDACAGCHNLIDPIGLAFEGFDEIGRVRATLPDGKPVDPAGVISGFADGEDAPFANPRQLAETIAGSAEAAACMAKTGFRFAFSKLETDDDACAVEGLAKSFAANKLSLRELMVAMTQLEGFRYRRIGGTP